MRASVVVPTRNRAAHLDALLASLAGQTVDATEFEILVVDNASTDATAHTVTVWSERRPGVRRTIEPVAGVARARNRGIAEARGPVLAFVDDDVIADPGWLDALLRAYERWPTAGAVCGRADLLLDGSRPAWFGPEVAEWYSALDFGARPRLLEDPAEVPWTLNLSVRTDLARAIGGFSEHLGRVGDDLRSGEEAPFVAGIRATGAAVGYDPAARVQHVVPADRLRLGWLLRRAWAGGLHARDGAAATGGGDGSRLGHEIAHVTLRGWREAARRVRRVDDPREALVAELAQRTAGVAAVWAEGRALLR